MWYTYEETLEIPIKIFLSFGIFVLPLSITVHTILKKFSFINDEESNMSYLDYFLNLILYKHKGKYQNLKICLINLLNLENKYNGLSEEISYKNRKNIKINDTIIIIFMVYSFIILTSTIYFKLDYKLEVLLIIIPLLIITLILISYYKKQIKKYDNKFFILLFENCKKDKQNIDLVSLKNITKIIIDKIDYRLNINNYQNNIQIQINVIIIILTFVTSFGILFDIKSSDLKIYLNEYKKDFIRFNDILENNFFTYASIGIFTLAVCYILVYFIDLILYTFITNSRKHNENLIFLKNQFNNILESLMEEQMLLNKLYEINIELEEIYNFNLNQFEYEIQKEKQIKIFNLEIERNKINRQLEILRKEFDL